MDTIDDNELFKQMKQKKYNDNVSQDSTSKDSKDDTNIKKIEKNGFDYYKILGADKDTNINDIKKRYRKLLAKYHPDKYKEYPEKERKTKEKQFQLVQIAGKVLTDESAKKVYDLEQKTIKSKDFHSQKNTFEEFIKLQEAGMTEENKKRAQIDFESETNKLNKLRGFDPDKMKEKLDKKDLDNIIIGIKSVASWYEILEKVKTYIDENGKRPSEKSNKSLCGWLYNQLYKSKKRLGILKIKKERI